MSSRAIKRDRHRRAVRIARDPDGQAGKNRRTHARELSAAVGVDDGLFPIYRPRADGAAASNPGRRDPSHRFRLQREPELFDAQDDRIACMIRFFVVL